MASPSPRSIAHIKEASAEAVGREQGARAEGHEQQGGRGQGEECEGLSHGAALQEWPHPRRAKGHPGQRPRDDEMLRCDPQ